MARINTYQIDGSISANDIVIGSEYNGINSTGIPIYKTKNYRMSDLQLFFGGGNFEFAAPITIQTTDAGNKEWIHNNITVSTPDPAVELLTHNGGTNEQFTVVTGITTDAYTKEGLTVTKGHVKQINTTTYKLPDYKFNIAADSNPGSDDAFIDIYSSSFDTLNVLGGTVLTSKITAGDTITIDHNEYDPKSITTDAVDVLHTFTSDVYGHVTAATKRTLPTFGGADTSENTPGSVGVVPAPAVNDELKFLRGDATWAVVVQTSITTTDGTFIDLTPNSATSGSVTVTADLSATGTASNATFLRGDNQWATPPGTYTLPLATSSLRGGVKIGYAANATNYPVELTQEKMYVNVPTYSAAVSDAAGTTGLMPGAAAGQQNYLMTGGGVWRGLTFTRTGKQYNNSGNPVIGIDFSDDGNRTSFTVAHADTNSGNQLAVSNTGRNVIQSITIDPYGHITSMASDDMSYASSDFNHDDLTGFVANEHIDWTTDQGNTNIHSGNYTNTTYSEATSSSEGLMSIAHHDKLDGIENNATADQTAAELRTKIGTGNGNLVPAQGTSGHFLNHLGAFSLPPNTTYSANSGVDLAGTVFSLDVTSTTANSFFQVPFFNSAANALSRDASTSSSIFFNPNSNTFSVEKISIGTTSTLTSRSIYSESSTSNYFEIANTSTSNGGRMLFGCTTSGFNGIYSRNHNNSAGREFRLIQLSTTAITVATSGNTTVNGTVTADDFIVISDKRLKSEIEPIKEGLEVIKKFTSYNYIKAGKKESGFIAQEVQEVLPHTVYENEEGMLSMSDRGVLAHMHKAILELEKRLISIEEKLN